jgi:hypothetical protein
MFGAAVGPGRRHADLERHKSNLVDGEPTRGILEQTSELHYCLCTHGNMSAVLAYLSGSGMPLCV